MDTKISDFSSEWILHDHLNPLESMSFEHDIIDQMFEMPEQMGRAVFNRYILPLDLAISNAKTFYTELIPGKVVAAPPVNIEFQYETLFIQHLRTGSNSLHEGVTNQKITYGRGADHIRFQKKFVLNNNFHCDEQIDLYSLSVPLPVLNLMLGESLAHQLLEELNLMPAPGGRKILSNSKINSILYEAFDKNFTKELLKAYMQSKSLEFVTAFCEHVLSESFVNKETSSDQLAINIYQKLITTKNELPTLADLVQQFKRPVRVLNGVFKEKYGISIIKFIIHLRLEQAQEAIKNSNIPLKVISDKLGYSHVNNFTIAFKNYFGYPPSSLRKKLPPQ